MKTGDTLKVKELDSIEGAKFIQFVSDSQDVEPFNEEHGEDYDSYYVLQAHGVILQLFGMYGIVPYLNNAVYKVV